MLRLKGITKDYKVADTKVRALRGIDLSFRANEFVSILGPSGCGKTTLLNIIGGLDKYTTGDLFIGGRSTKFFKDKDWDVYRNNRIGFIFQSYNLIPHQTVLGNVELALTIAGMSKTERVAKAKAALDKVGLKGQYYKRPNQLSGGQCQRVAIARALVNDPEILLADEPTGALDTVTSVQIMELVKEIAQERLVIMVTHNPDIAEKYSTRIIRLLDGELLSDSRPFAEFDEMDEVLASQIAHKEKEAVVGKKKEKAKMSFFTAFRLSLQNLFSKKARTVMTSIAGSIGIIGVSLVLSMSYGIQSFISNMQNDMLSGNPVQITQTAFDLNSMMGNMSITQKKAVAAEAGYVNVQDMMDILVERATQASGVMVNNKMTKDYVDFIKEIPSKDVAAITLDYGFDVTNNIFVDFKESVGSAPVNMSMSTLRAIYTEILKQTQYKQYASLITGLASVFMQAPSSQDYVMSQYDIIDGGKYPSAANEIMIVANQDTQLTDLLLAQLGYYSQEEFINLVMKAGKEPFDKNMVTNKFTYEALKDHKFTWYPNDTLFKAPADWHDAFRYNGYYSDDFEGGLELKIVGILKPKAGTSYGSLSSGFYYTDAFSQYVLDKNLNSVIAKDPLISVTGAYGAKGMIEVVPGSGVKEEKDFGILFDYSFNYNGTTHNITNQYLGKSSAMSSMLSIFDTGGSGIDMSALEIVSISINELGGRDLPTSISIYPGDFGHKDKVIAYLDQWNSDKTIFVGNRFITAADRELDSGGKITYSDPLSLVFQLIGDLINIITVALIGFTALSLVVSCVMIAIITYVSVVERTKEIGVIRSLGGRKKDVSHLFNAETFIIGLVSGLIGIGFTYFATFVINVIVNFLVNVTIAKFPIHYAIIMVTVSILLTLISGLLPSRSAAKKDPVVALRTE